MCSSRKNRYKVQLMVGFFSVMLAYRMITAQDVPDVNPKVPLALRSLTYTEISRSTPVSSTASDDIAITLWPAGTKNCTPPTINDFPPDLFTSQQRKQGAVVVHFLASIYIFYVIALICDDYFVPSIESICQAMHLPPDIAGATFMAIATSAPELFTNVIGTFVTHGDLGVGTVVGSAVFNILAVSALCGLFAKEPLQLDWWSLTRDCTFYAVSVILLLIVLGNRQVTWYEGVVMLILYLGYITVMYYNSACKKWAERLVHSCTSKKKHKSRRESRQEFVTTGIRRQEDAEKAPLLAGFKSYAEDEDESPQHPVSIEQEYEILIEKALHETEVYAEDEEEEWGLCSIPLHKGWLKWVEWTVGWPARFFLTITIPDCRQHRFRKWYPVTFLVCIIWIALLTYAMAWMMTVIGSTLSIPDSVMGLTFIAAGTSVPEAMSSIIVTRQGLGSMGISNSIGSNTFDILICLGVPWLIRASLIAPDHIKIISGGLEYSTILLISSVIVLYVLLACNSFILDKRIGFTSLTMYGAFLAISSLLELNVFFPVNLPTCTS